MQIGVQAVRGVKHQAVWEVALKDQLRRHQVNLRDQGPLTKMGLRTLAWLMVDSEARQFCACTYQPGNPFFSARILASITGKLGSACTLAVKRQSCTCNTLPPADLAAVEVQGAGDAQAPGRGRAAELHVARQAHVEHDRIHRAQLGAQGDSQPAQPHCCRACLCLALHKRPFMISLAHEHRDGSAAGLFEKRHTLGTGVKKRRPDKVWREVPTQS